MTAAQREELGDFRFVEDVMTRVKVKIKLRLESKAPDNSGGANAESASDAAEDEENAS